MSRPDLWPSHVNTIESDANCMKSDWKICVAQILIILLLCNQIYSFSLISFSSIYYLLTSTQVKFFLETNILFMAIVVSVCVSFLWTREKIGFMLFVLGQAFIDIGIYDPFSLQRYALIGIQIVGLVLFFFGSGKIIIFLSKKRGLDFIRSIISRNKGRE